MARERMHFWRGAESSTRVRNRQEELVEREALTTAMTMLSRLRLARENASISTRFKRHSIRRPPLSLSIRLPRRRQTSLHFVMDHDSHGLHQSC